MTTPYRISESYVGSHPPVARLKPAFDVGSMLADLNHLDRHQWSLQQSFETDGPVEEADFDWRALPLRSPTGDVGRTDPGGPGLESFANTAWMDEAPYLRDVLASIPAPLRCVRLLALGPGARTDVHFDTKVGFPWGTVRLHVPLVTNPGATLLLDGEIHRWQPGEFWFGDFCRMHQVENTGDRKRIHMVIDTMVTPELLELFGDDFREALDPAEVLHAGTVLPLGGAARYETEFPVPAPFLDMEEAEGEFLRSSDHRAARVDADGDRLVMSVDGEPRFGLVHLGAGTFRFNGWTDERTVRLPPDGAPAVTLRTRFGAREQRLDVPAAALRSAA